MANQIEFKLKTSADLQGVKQLKKELAEVRKYATEGLTGSTDNSLTGASVSEIQQIIKSANVLESSLQTAFNPKINTVDIEKFNTTISKSGFTIETLSQNLMKAGPAGQKAFLSMTNQLTTMGSAVKKTNAVIEQMGTTLKNTVKWGISSGLWNTMLSTTQQAYGYIKGLDSSLNDIRIVTGMSADEMERFGASANDAAKNLAVSTKDFTEGALIYFQQGLDEDTSTRLAEITAKAANVTGQSMAQVSEELTAVWNGYGVAAEDAERSVDSLAAIAAHSASDLQELSVGMSKVASAAAAMGVGEDQLASQISTIISITRQAPESVGTALKTIYARMSSIQAGAEEEGVNLMKYTKTMAEMGVNVLDANNKLRDMGDVIEEIGAKWQTMSREQQVALAQTMAGTRQYNNLVALFDNFDQYNEMMKVSANSAGTLQQQQETYLESINAKYEQLGAAAEGLYSSLFDVDSIGNILDVLTELVEHLDLFVDTIGGLNTIIPLLGTVGLRVFKDQIGGGIADAVTNSRNLNAQLEIQKRNAELLKEYNFSQMSQGELPAVSTDAMQRNSELAQLVADSSVEINQEQLNQIKNLQTMNADLADFASKYDSINDKILSISEKYRELNVAIDKEKLTEEGINELLEQQNENMAQFAATKDSLAQSESTFKIGNIDYSDIKLNNADNIISQLDASIPNGYEEYLTNVITDIKKGTLAGDELEQQLIEIKKVLQLDNIDDSKIESIINNFLELENAISLPEKAIQHFNSSLSEIQKNTNISDKTIALLKERFSELSKENLSYNEIIGQLGKEFDDTAKYGTEVTTFLQELKIKMEQAKGAGQDFKESLKMQEVVSSFSNMAGAVGQLVMAWSQLKNLGSIWTDEDATTGEKIEKTIMALTMAIPMMSSAYSTLTNKKNLDTIATWLNTAAEEANTKAKGENAVAANAEAASQGLSQIGKQGGAVITTLGAGVSKLFTSITTGIEGIVSAIPGIGWAIIGVTVLVGAANAAWKAYKKEVAEAASESAAKAQEEYDAIKQTTEATEELSKAYEELNGQRDSMSVEEYKNSLFRLCEQYGLESEALRVLAGDYNVVADAIKNKQEAEKEEFEKAAEQNAIASKNAFSANFRASLSGSQDDNGYYDFSTGFGNSQELENILKRFNVQIEGGKIGSESLVDAVATYGQEFINAVTEGHEKDTQRLADALNKMTEQVNSAYSANQDYKEVATSSYISKYGLNDSNKSGLELSKGIDTAAEEMKKDKNLNYSVEEAKQALYSELDNIGNDNILKSKIVDYISKGLDVTPEDVFNKIENYTSDELSNVVANIEGLIKIADKQVVSYDKILEKSKEINSGVALNLLNSTKAVEEVLSNLGDKELSEEQLGSLKNLESFQNYLSERGTTFQFFSEEDYATQLQLISAFYESIREEQATLRDTYSQDIEQLTAEAQSKIDELEQKTYTFSIQNESGETDFIEQNLEDAKETAQNKIDELVQIFQDSFGDDETLLMGDSYIEYIDGMFNSAEEAAEQYKEYLKGNTNELKDNVKALFNTFTTGNGQDLQDAGINGLIDEETLENIQNAIKDSEEYTDALDAVNSYTNSLISSNEELSQSLEDINGIYSVHAQNVNALMNEIDSLQATYKSLNSVVDDYNEKGYMTIDNMQTILSMSPEQLAALDMENGKLSINSQMLQQVTMNRLNEAEAELYQQYTAVLLAIADENVATAEGAAAEMARQFIAMANGASAAAAGAVPNLQAYANALAAARSANAGAAAAADADFQKRLSAINQAKASVTSNFAGAMGGVKSGGGGGGGGKKQDKDPQKSEINHYKQLERAIDSVENALKQLQDRQKHLNGDALVKNLKEQNKEYLKQAAALKKLYAASEKQVTSYRKTLKDEGFNVKYDKDRNITQKSYEQAYNKELKRYNKAVDTYNKSSKGESDEKALENAKKRYDKFKEYIDKYNEAIAKTEDIRNQMLENIQNVADTNLAKFNAKFDLDMDTKKAEKKWNEFQRKISKDFRKVALITAKDIEDIYGSALDSQSLFNTDASKIEHLTEQYEKMQSVLTGKTGKKNGIENGVVDPTKVDKLTKALKKAGVEYTTVADLQKDMNKTFEELQDYAEEVFDAFQKGWEDYIEQIDQTIDKMDELNQKFEDISSQNEYYLKIAELTAGVYDKSISAADQLNNVRMTYYNTEIENGTMQLEAMKANLDALKKHEEYLRSIGDIQNEDYEKTVEGIRSQTKALQEQAIETQTLVKERLELQKTMDYEDLSRKLAGPDEEGNFTQTIEEARQAWEDTLKYQERYYDNTQALYQLDMLGEKYDNAIKNEGLSLKNQERLKKLREQELKDLKQKDKLTKDDIALANKRYQIYLMEAQLEEARNSKNTMKVTRNEEGNWSYQYVADEEDIESKQAALTQEYAELYDMAKKAYQDSITLALEAKEEFLKRYKEIMDNTTLTDEERMKRIEELNKEYFGTDGEPGKVTKYYQESSEYQGEQATAAVDAIKIAYDTNVVNYQDMDDKQRTIIDAYKQYSITTYDEIRDAYKLDIDEMKTKINDIVDGDIKQAWERNAKAAEDSFNNSQKYCEIATNNIIEYVNQYDSTTKTVEASVGDSWSNISKKISDSKEAAKEARDESMEFAKQIPKSLKESHEAVKKLAELWGNVKTKLDACKAAMDKLAKAAEIGIQKMKAVQQAAQSAAAASSRATSAASSGGGGYGGGGTGGTETVASKRVSATANGAYSVYYTSTAGNTKTVRYGSVSGGADNINPEKDKGDPWSEVMLSGGYTGSWTNGSDLENGRMAMLHQKELVLNEKDTANFLEAINTIRDLSSLSNSISDIIKNKIAQMIANMMGVSVSKIENQNNKNSNNNITYHINAEFPNATDKDSILAAFNSLPNMASQRVNAKLR